MNKISVTEAVERSLNLNRIDFAPMLGIGPMSKTLIKASINLAKEKDFPLMFIASRNQVDKKELGGGYVCNWDQKGFADTIKKIANDYKFDGLYYLCRDHGGPWQRDNERKSHLPEEIAMNLGKESYLEDLLQGFDLLHIDPTKDPYIVGKNIDMDIVLNRTVDIIEFIEIERIKRNLSPISYEVGTEETNGGLTSIDCFEEFIHKLTVKLKEKNLPKPCFIVGQTGTLTRMTENVGQFNPKIAKNLSDVAKKYGMGLKEHNGDYLSEDILTAHQSLGITAMNVAPEFGTVETRAYLKLVEVEQILFNQGIISKKSRLKEELEKEAVSSRRWEKWMTNDIVNKNTNELLKDSQSIELILDISGHYTFNLESVKKEIDVLYKNLNLAGINGEKYVIFKLKESLNKYVECFNLEGLTSKLLGR